MALATLQEVLDCACGLYLADSAAPSATLGEYTGTKCSLGLVMPDQADTTGEAKMRHRVRKLVGASVIATLTVAMLAATVDRAAAATYGETTGGVAHTWTNPSNAGGSEGPEIGSNQTVQIACALSGFKVADGNIWWYEIASSPWNYAYFVSADAFYNNGAVSGSLRGTPFVDPAVPICGSASGVNETTGGVAHTWTNPSNAGGAQGPTIGSNQTIQIACRLTGFRVADGNVWWYQIASAPWNNGFYASADAFYNNGSVSGSLKGTPFFDPTVPVCADTSSNGSNPAVQLAQGPAAPAGYRYAITVSGFPAGATVSLTCDDSKSPSGFYTFKLTANESGAASTASYCYSGDGPDHWVIANGRVESNHVSWGPGSSSTPPPGSGGSGGTRPGAPTTVNGINVGYPQNARHGWGSCSVQDFNGGPYGWVIVDYTHGVNIIRNGMLFGWFEKGGGPGTLHCAQSSEYSYYGGSRQNFDGGHMLWCPGWRIGIPWVLGIPDGCVGDTPAQSCAADPAHSYVATLATTRFGLMADRLLILPGGKGRLPALATYKQVLATTNVMWPIVYKCAISRRLTMSAGEQMSAYEQLECHLYVTRWKPKEYYDLEDWRASSVVPSNPVERLLFFHHTGCNW